jgi:hypothetical protein
MLLRAKTSRVSDRTSLINAQATLTSRIMPVPKLKTSDFRLLKINKEIYYKKREESAELDYYYKLSYIDRYSRPSRYSYYIYI